MSFVDAVWKALQGVDRTTKIPWEKAYKLNKTRDVCVLCGKKTRDTPLFSSIVKTCPCVDKLAKGG